MARPLDEISEQAFVRSEEERQPNFALLALAIGQWATRQPFSDHAGPDWALEACKKYYEQSITGTRKISEAQKGSPGRSDDGEVLELVADLLVDPAVRKRLGCFNDGKDLSQNRAIKTALSAKTGVHPDNISQSEINRIAYHWTIDADRRKEAACQRRVRNFMKHQKD